MAEGLYRQPVAADSVRTGVPSLLLSHFGDHPFLGGRTNTSPKRGPIATAPRIALAALVVRRRICSVVVSLIFFWLPVFFRRNNSVALLLEPDRRGWVAEPGKDGSP
jgi:hypothetical protein